MCVSLYTHQTIHTSVTCESGGVAMAVVAAGVAGILEAIAALKNNFGSKFDRVLTAINGIKLDIKDFSGRNRILFN